MGDLDMTDLLACIGPEQFAILSSVVAVALSEGLSPDETNSLGNFLVAAGSAMLVIAAQQQLLSGNQGNIEVG
jgi:hypothetical protein